MVSFKGKRYLGGWMVIDTLCTFEFDSDYSCSN